MKLIKTPGQMAYEADLLKRPNYHDGKPRRAWHELGEPAQSSWRRNPISPPSGAVVINPEKCN